MCKTEKSRCAQPCNGSFPFGIEKHTFNGRLDLRSQIAGGCCKFEISVLLYVRNVGITTGQSQQSFYTSCEFDACKGPSNSSPALTNDPVAILCCNQPFAFNNGATDFTDRDSISYAFAPAFSGRSTQCSYSSTRTFANPIATYYPGSLVFPFSNPNANPPIGTYLNPITGDMVFTPINCSEVAVVVIQMTEWRKDTTGVYREIGKTRRDMQIIVMTCPGNNPPIVNGPYSYSVCEGNNLCFNVTTNDITFQPPPPATAPPADTVTTSWNAGIPGASFTIINPTALHQTGRFCWTPGTGTASDLPYNFTVTARDNACPLNAVSVRAFRVTVKFRAAADRVRDTLPCGVYAVRSNPITGFRGTPSYTWNILDVNQNIVLDRKIAKFKFSGSYFSTRRSDTLVFTKGGTYIIEHTINNSPNNCPTSYYDTLVVPPLLEADLSLGKDTFVCAGTQLLFRPTISNYNPPLTYQWSTMGVNNNGSFIKNATVNAADNKDTFRLTIPGVQYDTAVAIWIKDGSGCTAVDSIQVFLKANPVALLPTDARICTYDSITIVPDLTRAYWVDPILGDTLTQGDTLTKEWFYNGSLLSFSTADSVTTHIAGEYMLRVVDSLGCTDTDTFLLFVNDTVTALAGPDQVLCFGDDQIITAGGIDTAGTGKSGLYQWRQYSPTAAFLGTNTSYTQSATVDKNFRLQLFMTQSGKQCTDDDSVFIDVNPLPTIALTDDKNLCCDYGLILMNSDVITPAGTPATGGWSVNSHPFLMKNNTFYTDSACGLISAPANLINVYAVYTYTDPSTTCVNRDSIRITVNSLPNLTLTPKVYCQDKNEVSLDDEIVLSPANTSLGTPTWRCLDSNASANQFRNNILVNKGSALFPDWWINISEARYTIQNADQDTLVLEFTYINAFGCRNKDTVNIIIAKVPKITFSRNRDLCWDEGIVSLNDLTGVNLTDGTWSCQDTAGFRPCAQLGGISGDQINTLSSVPLASATTTPNQWRLRYDHTATGCPATNTINIRINPLPTITLNPFPKSNYCDAEANVALTPLANPSGGTWTATDPSALIGGNTFSPGSASVFSTPISFRYNYTNPATGCSNKDSISVIVDPSPTIAIPANDEFCRAQGVMTMPLNLPVSATNTNDLTWGALGANSARVTLGSDPTIGSVSLALQNNTSDTFILYANAAGLASCSDVSDVFQIIVHPIPDASIFVDNPAACNPLTSTFGVDITNSVNPATAQYNWTLNGTTSSIATPTSTFTTDGLQNISVVVTSAQGCDTTLTSTVTVHPIPVASFVPNPNNFTTAALPRFLFENLSTVSTGSIALNEWDFGDLLVTTDVSNEISPTYYYRTDTGSYVVNLRVTSDQGCTDEFSYPVFIGPDLIVFIPNAFVPDQAGPTENEGFKAIISGEKTMELTIFNRWGEILFQTNKKNEEWYGTYKGLPVQQDVYAYTLKVVALNDEVYEYSGTITLIR
jgi:gliding motility-associated-like protein